jgi:hypothetical protein
VPEEDTVSRVPSDPLPTSTPVKVMAILILLPVLVKNVILVHGEVTAAVIVPEAVVTVIILLLLVSQKSTVALVLLTQDTVYTPIPKEIF